MTQELLRMIAVAFMLALAVYAFANEYEDSELKGLLFYVAGVLALTFVACAANYGNTLPSGYTIPDSPSPIPRGASQ